jgi:hypothetical protein
VDFASGGGDAKGKTPGATGRSAGVSPANGFNLFSGNKPAGHQRSQGKLKLELQRAPPLDSLAGIA